MHGLGDHVGCHSLRDDIRGQRPIKSAGNMVITVMESVVTIMIGGHTVIAVMDPVIAVMVHGPYAGVVGDGLVDEGFSIPDSEEVAMLHNADEEVCRKHLKSFQQLAEIGFPSKDVHQALIASSFDHQKALEQLIG